MIKIKWIVICTVLMPLLMAIVIYLAVFDKEKLKTEKYLISLSKQYHTDKPVFFLDRTPTFSARFYSQEIASSISMDELRHYLPQQSIKLILKKQQLNELIDDPTIQVDKIAKSKKFILTLLSTKVPLKNTQR